MDADWPSDLCSFQHPVKRLGDVVQRLAHLQSWEEVGVPKYLRRILQNLYRQMV